jgi:predicted nucleic acid-binding protein
VIAAYIDASVVLRIILEQDGPLREWNRLEVGVSSRLLEVECYRTIERLWRQRELDDAELELKRTKLAQLLRYIELLEIDRPVIALATRPFPTHVASLDAIHLATAILYRKAQRDDERPIHFAKHDVALARAATAMHFDVIGALA